MKKLFILILVLSSISFVMMILDFLALTDIAHDYLSEKVLVSENIVGDIKILPEWTNCTLEWSMLKIDFLFSPTFD